MVFLKVKIRFNWFQSCIQNTSETILKVEAQRDNKPKTCSYFIL